MEHRKAYGREDTDAGRSFVWLGNPEADLYLEAVCLDCGYPVHGRSFGPDGEPCPSLYRAITRAEMERLVDKHYDECHDGCNDEDEEEHEHSKTCHTEGRALEHCQGRLENALDEVEILRGRIRHALTDLNFIEWDVKSAHYCITQALESDEY